MRGLTNYVYDNTQYHSCFKIHVIKVGGGVTKQKFIFAVDLHNQNSHRAPTNFIFANSSLAWSGKLKNSSRSSVFFTSGLETNNFSCRLRPSILSTTSKTFFLALDMSYSYPIRYAISPNRASVFWQNIPRSSYIGSWPSTDFLFFPLDFLPEVLDSG